MARRTERPVTRPPQGRVVTPPAANQVSEEEAPAAGTPEAGASRADTPAEEIGEDRTETGQGVPADAPGDVETGSVPVEGASPSPAGEEAGAGEETPAPAPEEIAAGNATAGAETTPEPAPRSPAEEAPARAETPPAGGPFYGVHVESFPTREDADRAADRFREAGETVTIIEKAIPDKGTWFRIVLGRFATAGAAANHVDEVKAAFGLDYGLAVRVNP